MESDDAIFEDHHKAAVDGVFQRGGADCSRVLIASLERHAERFRSRVLVRELIPAAVRISEVNDLTRLSINLWEALQSIDPREESRLAARLGEDYGARGKFRVEVGLNALSECENLVENLCSATLYAEDKANWEIYDGGELADVELRTLCANVWRETQSASEITKATQSPKPKTRARATRLCGSMLGICFSALGLAIDQRTIKNLSAFTVDGVKPPEHG